MSDYLEREAALAVCQKEYEERLSMADWCGDTVAWNIGSAIKNIPAADVAPAVHARWEDVFQDGPCSWSGKCSRCRVRNDIPPLLLAHYCPNCGARMDGKEGEHETD